MDMCIYATAKLLFMVRSAHVIMKKVRHRLLLTQVYVKPRSSKLSLICTLKNSRGHGKSGIENKLGVRHTSQHT